MHQAALGAPSNTTISSALPNDIHSAARAAASAKGLSISAYIRRAIIRSISEDMPPIQRGAIGP
jgi:hypothetical protein